MAQTGHGKLRPMSVRTAPRPDERLRSETELGEKRKLWYTHGSTEQGGPSEEGRGDKEVSGDEGREWK